MKNKINDNTLTELYHNYSTMDVESFRTFCKNLVETSRQANAGILNSMPNMNKDQLLKTVNNFAFKGQGFGVIR